MLDFSEIREENRSMNYLTFSFLVLVLAFSVEVNAQSGSSNNASGKLCEQYKIGIITPSKDIDFKIKIIVPPKNIDQAMVINPCPEQNQVASAPQIIVPRKEMNELFKVPPFTIKNKYSKQ
jgi:hypothetical protein